MIILGINGYPTWSFHDPAACLIIDGNLESFIEEERLSRVKHAPNQAPVLSVEACLRKSKISWEEIDYIAVGWDLPAFAEQSSVNFTDDEIIDLLLKSINAPKSILKNQVVFIPHHQAHAWSGISLNQEEQALVVVIDGQGENESTSVFRYKNNRLGLLSKLDARYSLGFFYEAASWFTGLGLSGTGKLMGLASYGNHSGNLAFNIEPSIAYDTPIPKSLLLKSHESIEMDHAISMVNKYWIPHFTKKFPNMSWDKLPVELPFNFKNKLHKIQDTVNIATYAQESIEKATISLINKYLINGDTSIILTGGVSLNCKLNGLISDLYPEKNIHIQCAGNDAGTALGAAVCLSYDVGISPVNIGTFPYMGESFSNSDIETYILLCNVKYIKLNDKVSEAAKYIESNKVIGWFQGESEVGPRSLGARSIISRADSTNIRNRVNREIKHREIWRPLAPIIMDEYGSLLFKNYKYSPYMLKALYCTKEGEEMLSGTTHVDSTARPQSVLSNDNTNSLNLLLNEVYKRTEIPAILNTSFNVAGQPVVYSPKDAISTFLDSNLDALIIGDYLITH